MDYMKKYIAEHGKHLTIELALSVPQKKWKPSEILSSTQKKVYYNCTSATDGDIVYITNMLHDIAGWNKPKCIKYTLLIIGDYKGGRNYAFNHFIASPFFKRSLLKEYVS